MTDLEPAPTKRPLLLLCHEPDWEAVIIRIPDGALYPDGQRGDAHYLIEGKAMHRASAEAAEQAIEHGWVADDSRTLNGFAEVRALLAPGGW